jgi:peptidyl-prolyl cis-trans isomerase D
MIRLLQQDSRTMKILFAVIIGAAAITMVITLVPGIFDNSGATNDATVYATVKEPGFFGRTIGDSTAIKTVEVNQLAARQLQQQHLPEQLMPYLLPRAGQILVQRAILKHEADRMNLQVSDEDLRRELQTGPFAQYLFPNGKYIGDDAYINFVSSAFGGELSRSDLSRR